MTVGSVVVLGETARVSAFALAGATVRKADDPEDVRRAWQMLPEDVAVVVLTERAAAVLRAESTPDRLLCVVMPR